MWDKFNEKLWNILIHHSCLLEQEFSEWKEM